MTTTQKYQYSQPTEKPAQPPIERRAYSRTSERGEDCESAKEPTDGLAEAISPSIRITSTIRTPASR